MDEVVIMLHHILIYEVQVQMVDEIDEVQQQVQQVQQIEDEVEEVVQHETKYDELVELV